MPETSVGGVLTKKSASKCVQREKKALIAGWSGVVVVGDHNGTQARAA